MSAQSSLQVEEAADYDPFAGGGELARVVPTTEPQREVWLADRLGRDASLAYNESISLRLRGALDVEALRAAVRDLVARHEALRSTVGTSGEELLVAAAHELDVPLVDLRSLSAAEREERLAAAKRRVVETPFDLEKGPLVRAEIAVLAGDDHVLILTAHHIVCDGWSFGVLMRDLAALYRERARKGGAALAPAAAFADYAAAQARAESGPQHAEDEKFWLARFTGSAPVLDLPTDRPRAAFRTFASRREDYTLDAELVSAVRKAGSKQGASVFATLLAGFAALMQRVCGAQDVVVGIPSAGQQADGFGTLVGHCVNLLPVRLAVDPSSGANALVAATQTAMLDAQEHAAYTFGTLLKKLSLPRDTSRLPLVSVMFNLDQALDANALGFPDLRAEFTSNARSFENFELFVNAVQVEGGSLRLETQYNADLFDAATVRRWLAGYEALLRSAAADMAKPVGRLTLVTGDDRRLLAQWNDTAADYDRGARVHTLFEAQARSAGSKPAIAWGAESLTYAALDAEANRIARALRARGVRRGSLVGLHLARSPRMVAAMLGVLKAGGAYVPLDPAYPADRLAFMAQDAALAVLVSEQAGVPAVDRRAAPLEWPRDRTLNIDADAATIAAHEATPLADDGEAAQPFDRAYVIYTSGSTGKPKGVQVPHRAVVNFLASMAKEPGLGADDRLVAVTTLSFDIAVNELLLPLARGALIVLASTEEAGDGAALLALLEKHSATVMQATPATWRLLLEAGWKGSKSLRALCGGEALSAELARELLPRVGALWNMYGPTETTVWSTCIRIADAKSISIGRPIANTQVWILDEMREDCPIGVPGEVCIGGDGVTLGYLARPELTAERFIDDPHAPGARLYRTGDRGRWRADGTLEHLGRLDFQVKVRGYRIELGEIEAALGEYAGITQAVAMAREDRPGDVRLVAYVVATTSTDVGEEALKAHLRRSLPAYMVPQHFVALPAIPRLPNGKVDRRALPAPQAAAHGADFVAPRTELEKAVAAEMEAALGLPGIGVHDDFFTLGGHSLLAAQLTARLNRALGTQLGMRSLFASPTVEKLAAAIEAQRSGGAPAAGRKAITPLADRHAAPLSVMQERLFFLEELYPGRVTYNAPSAHRLRGPIDEAAFQRAFDEMLRRQASLRTSFARDGDTVIQRIHDDVRFPLFPAEDLTKLPAQTREADLLARLDELTDETFDLSKAPLFKARLFRLGPEDHVLFFMPHHIVWDGWSFDLLYDEMSALYGAFSAGKPSPLADLPVAYGDFAAWHHDWMQGGEFGEQLDFWKKRLEKVGRIEELPTDKPRRPGMSGAGETEWIHLHAGDADRLHALSQRAGTTMFVTTLALYAMVLHGYSGQKSLVVGTPVRGRNVLELERIMGYFNNLVPLHLEIDPAEPFTGLLARVKAAVVEGFGSPDVPLERLARELSVARGAGGSILYQALFSFQDARQRITQWGELAHETIPLFQRGATEDLGMWFLESAGGLHGGVTYNTDILTAETARDLHQAYAALVRGVLAAPDTPVGALVSASGLKARTAPPPATAAPAARTGGTPPATETEKLLASLWCEQLKLPQVALEDNFFDLGGHSLLAMQAILAMESRTKKRVDRNRYIFETLGQIARAYDEAPLDEPAAKPAGLRGLLSGMFGGRK